MFTGGFGFYKTGKNLNHSIDSASYKQSNPPHCNELQSAHQRSKLGLFCPALSLSLPQDEVSILGSLIWIDVLDKLASSSSNSSKSSSSSSSISGPSSSESATALVEVLGPPPGFSCAWNWTSLHIPSYFMLKMVFAYLCNTQRSCECATISGSLPWNFNMPYRSFYRLKILNSFRRAIGTVNEGFSLSYLAYFG